MQGTPPEFMAAVYATANCNNESPVMCILLSIFGFTRLNTLYLNCVIWFTNSGRNYESYKQFSFCKSFSSSVGLIIV